MDTINYPTFELELLRRNQSLMESIVRVISDANMKKLFVSDGFFPYYTMQPIRILFIGKESLENQGKNYIDELYKAYKRHKVGDKPLNQYQFHALMLKIAYGIQNDYPAWSEIPKANVIADFFGSENGISFAFINLSKLSNETGVWEANTTLMQAYLNAISRTDKDFLSEQIMMLDPDIIITHNLINDWGKYFGNIDFIRRFPNEANHVFFYSLNIDAGRKIIPILDCYHFSAIKTHKENFYEPIIEACKAIFRSR